MSLERNCRWHFAESLGGQDQGPNEAMGENFKKNPFEALVRESIQNSLDVASQQNTDPVVVSFIFRDTEGKSFPQLMSLDKHMQGCLDLYDDETAHLKFDPMLKYISKASSSKLDYLEISDENTTGMDYVKNDTKCGFYSFVKSAGNSSKSSQHAGGSFGFGKAAYYNVSKMRTVLISTLTEENKYYFEGVSSLCTHKEGDKKYVPVGFYCNTDDEEPISDINEIPDLFRRKTIGTSMFIMGLGLEGKQIISILQHEINEAIVRHFWLAILRKKLIVRAGINDKCYEFNSANIEKYASQIFADYDDLKRGHKNPRPYIDAVVHAGEDEDHLKFSNHLPTLGDVELYLIKSQNGNDYILNMRAPLMLVNHSLNRTNYGFYSVFVCEDEQGNKILRKMENPAHNEWDQKNAPAQLADIAEKAMNERKDFIQECIKQVFASQNDEGLTFGGLDDFLTIPSSFEDFDKNQDDGPAGDDGNSGNEEDPGDTPSATTTIEGDPTITKPTKPVIGTITVKQKKTPKAIDRDGKKTPTGHTPEFPPTKDDEERRKSEKKERKKHDKDKKPKQDEPNGNPDLPLDDDPDYGQPAPNLEPIKVSYRTFAQKIDNGYEHVIIIHSSRESSRIIISILSAGETSDDRLALRSSDNGSIVTNQLTKVHLAEGKNTIKVRFNDDMRHAIKLDIYEDQ